MKRMTENPMGYYTVETDDISGITPVSAEEKIFSYTPSQKFLDVLHEFKSALRVDWTEIYKPFVQLDGTSFTVLYPVNKMVEGYGGNIGYRYFGGRDTVGFIGPTFYESDGVYYIGFLS